MESTDAAAVAELAGQLGYPATEHDIAHRYRAISENSEHAVFVAENESERVIAWLHAFAKRGMNFDACVEITGLVVDEKCRGQGVGKKLLAKVEKWAFSRGYKTVAVRSQTKREEAHRFYLGAGYEQQKSQYKFVKRI